MSYLLTYFRNLGLRKKLLVSYAFVFVFSICVGGYISYKYTIDIIEKDVELQLKSATKSIMRLIKTSASVAIRSYMRALAEKSIERIYKLEKKADETKKEMALLLSQQKIGQNGFIYCLDKNGALVVVPERLKNPGRYSDLPIHIMRTETYLEYRESDYVQGISRPKADYAAFFPPWKWTVVVSAFRDELNDLVRVNDFKYVVLSHRFGKTGHCYILDTNGNMILHSSLQGKNRMNQADDNGLLYIQEICRLKSGRLIYRITDPETGKKKEILSVFHYLPDVNWIVVSEACLNEFYIPFKASQMLIIVASLALIVLMVPITYWLSASITRPINELMNHFEMGIKGDLAIRAKNRSTDEIGLLAGYFNSFMDKLQAYRQSLQGEMEERIQLEREILEISEKERFRIGQALHDDLCPHLIGIEALCKVLAQKLENSAPDPSRLAKDIRRLVGESIVKSRNLSKGLCPVAPGPSALESSLSDLARHTRKVMGVECRFADMGDSMDIDQPKAAHLYFIASESVLNAVRHSRATRITVTLDKSSPQLKLMVADNGMGFTHTSRNQGAGLDIMKYRANAIGATLEITSAPGEGSTVVCTMGVAAEKPADFI